MSELPSGWMSVKIGDVADLNPKHSYDTDREQLVSFVPMPAVDEESGTIRPHEARPLSEIWKGYTHFAERDVIFAKITPCMENGKSAVAHGLTGGIACGSTEFHVLRSLGGIEPYYLWRFLRRRSFRRDAEGAMTGAVGQRRVPSDYLLSQEIPLPPLAEQRRIVAKLDRVMARTAHARAELARIPALIAHHKRAILETVFQNEAWERLRFFDVLDFKGGSQPPKSTFSGAPGPGLVRLLQIRDFASDDKAVFIEDSSRWPKCEADDIMVGRYGASVGKILTGKAGAYNVALVKMIVDSRLSRRFVYYWLQSSVFQEALGIVSRSAQDGFNKGDLESVLVPVPSLQEQEAAVQMIDDALGRLERAAQEHAQATRLLDHLDQALLAKAFRGELVPQDPADEPAAALLARIRAERAGAAPPTRKRKARA